MTAAEAALFLAGPCAREAVALRRWDDAAKIPGLPVPELGAYPPLIQSLWC